MVKLQIIHSGEEKHSLSQDLARVLRLEPEDFTDTIVQSSPSPDGQSEFKTSSLIIKARSDPLGAMLAKHKDERYNVRSSSFPQPLDSLTSANETIENHSWILTSDAIFTSIEKVLHVSFFIHLPFSIVRCVL